MKRLLIILCAIGLTVSASAQRYYGHGGSYYRPRTRVVVSTGLYAPLYPYYGGYYGIGYPYYPYIGRPSRLELRIEDIQNDYRDRIWAARHDKTVPRKERRANVHRLKHERDMAIIQAKRDYYKVR